MFVLYYYAGRRSLLSCDPVLLWNKKANVRDIDILPGGDVIAACDDGLQVYNKRGQKIQHPVSDTCKLDFWGVSLSDDGANVAAVEWRGYDPGRLHIYTSVIGLWKHQMHNTCDRPVSVACTGDGHFVVGRAHNSMYKHNNHGQQILEKKLSRCITRTV